MAPPVKLPPTSFTPPPAHTGEVSGAQRTSPTEGTATVLGASALTTGVSNEAATDAIRLARGNDVAGALKVLAENTTGPARDRLLALHAAFGSSPEHKERLNDLVSGALLALG